MTQEIESDTKKYRYLKIEDLISTDKLMGLLQNVETDTVKIAVQGYITGLVEDRNNLGKFIFVLSDLYGGVVSSFESEKEEIARIESVLKAHEIKETIPERGKYDNFPQLCVKGSYLLDKKIIQCDEISFPRLNCTYKANKINLVIPRNN